MHRLPCRRFPDIRRNEKSHSSKISLRKVALNKRNLYFSFLPLDTAAYSAPTVSFLIYDIVLNKEIQGRGAEDLMEFGTLRMDLKRGSITQKLLM